jgi:hypothetical protein
MILDFSNIPLTPQHATTSTYVNPPTFAMTNDDNNDMHDDIRNEILENAYDQWGDDDTDHGVWVPDFDILGDLTASSVANDRTRQIVNRAIELSGREQYTPDHHMNQRPWTTGTRPGRVLRTLFA